MLDRESASRHRTRRRLWDLQHRHHVCLRQGHRTISCIAQDHRSDFDTDRSFRTISFADHVLRPSGRRVRGHQSFYHQRWHAAVRSHLVLRVLVCWTEVRSQTRSEIMKSGLTNRWSQPLAVAMRKFDFVKQFSKLATLAAASGGSVLSR
jgi:hypothetical protein